MSEAEKDALIAQFVSDLNAYSNSYEIDDEPTPASNSPSSDPAATMGIVGEVNGDPFERDHWLVYHADDIQVFRADADFVVEVEGRWLPDAYSTCDEAVLAARRSRAGSI